MKKMFMKNMLFIIVFLSFFSHVSFSMTVIEAQITHLQNIEESMVRVFYKIQKPIDVESHCYLSHKQSVELEYNHFDLDVQRDDFDMLFELILFAMTNNYNLLLIGDAECNGFIKNMTTLALR